MTNDLPSEILYEAAKELSRSSILPADITVPLEIMLEESADTWALYDRRGWSNRQVRNRIGSGDQAALELACAILGRENPYG